MWRDLDTLDVTNDLSFEISTTSTPETMDIRLGRAMLYINEATTGYNTPAKGPLEPDSNGDDLLRIPVWNNAMPLLTSVLFMKALWGLLF